MKISTSKLRRWEDFQETIVQTHEHVFYSIYKIIGKFHFLSKQTFSLLKWIWSKLESATGVLKQIETNLWKKDEKISKFASKFEVNFKWIWKEFEENSSLKKLVA